MLRNLSEVSQGSAKFPESRNTNYDEDQSFCSLFFRTTTNISDLQMYCFNLKDNKKKKGRQILVICRYRNLTGISKKCSA